MYNSDIDGNFNWVLEIIMSLMVVNDSSNNKMMIEKDQILTTIVLIYYTFRIKKKSQEMTGD